MDGLKTTPPTDSGPELADESTGARLETDGVLSSEFEAAATELRGVLDAGVERTRISNMTEPLGKGVHGHGPAKGEGNHDLRSAFNVNPEIIVEEFEPGVLPNGHEAVSYLLANRERLIDSETNLFLDVPDTTESRWAEIEATRRKAPISPQRESEIFADANGS